MRPPSLAVVGLPNQALQMRAGTLVAVSLALLAGVAGGVAALSGRGDQELFRRTQARALSAIPSGAVTASSVEAVVARAPEPVLAARRTPPVHVRCRPGGGGVLRDPWTCAIRYRSGSRARYRVTVQPDGRYSGVGSGVIDGCCVTVTGLE